MKYDDKASMQMTEELAEMNRMLSLFEALAVRLKSTDDSPGSINGPAGNSRVLLDSVMQPASHAIINIDERGNVIFCNRCAESIFDFSINKILGKPITSIIPENNIPYESLI